MDSKEAARQGLIKLMEEEASKAKQDLNSKEQTITVKRSKNDASLERRQNRCRDMFETQKRNYDRYTELSERKL